MFQRIIRRHINQSDVSPPCNCLAIDYPINKENNYVCHENSFDIFWLYVSEKYFFEKLITHPFIERRFDTFKKVSTLNIFGLPILVEKFCFSVASHKVWTK